MSSELVMPKMGESIAEATILKWLKKEGDTIEVDEAVLEIATDKVDSEVPASVGGVLLKILHPEGAVVPVGVAIALIGSANGSGAMSNANTSSEGADVAGSNGEQLATLEDVPHVPEIGSPGTPRSSGASMNSGDRFYSPLVMNISREEGISFDELGRIEGSGKEGRVTKADIMDYVSNKGKGGGAGSTSQSAPAQANQLQVKASDTQSQRTLMRVRFMI
jgi:2-oxoglutarate dehydrogenase E2 component (dihydrolipoamide succinyltransferase)